MKELFPKPFLSGRLFRWLCILFVMSMFSVHYNANAQSSIQMPVVENPFQQNFPEAKFKSRATIVLDQIAPLSEYYVADISGLNFKNEQEATVFFNRLMEESLSAYLLDFKSKRILIFLDLDGDIPDWGREDWNTYLNQLLSR